MSFEYGSHNDLMETNHNTANHILKAYMVLDDYEFPLVITIIISCSPNDHLYREKCETL